MNQHLYRIVFNKARGCLMAVAETAAAQGKAGERRNTAGGAADSGAGYPTRLASGLQTLALAMASAALLTSVAVAPQAQAQIVADPSAPANQRPTVLTTGSGNNIPLVNIQTPSAAGVSRNTYSQFDVQNNGAVLNNSRTNVQTQLGGWVQGNPWLATGSAKIILNEVNSNNPSQLRGAIEVAGQRAEVVIANPAGILVDGAGFINTSRATLTTGTPILNGGSLDGYRVQTGTITITGAGLDASSTDYTAILARAVSLNAGIWANTLNITTGANQISVDAGTTTATATTAIAGTGSVPSFALDVSAIGGMYAGKITLIGTEAGLGVRNAGVLVANAGDLVLGNDGWLSNTGSLTASQNLSAQTSGAITNSGTVYANGNTAVTSGGDTNNTGLIAALGNTTVTSGGSITSASGSVLAAGLAADNTVGSSGNLAVTATGTATLAGQSLAGADVQLTGSGVDISHGQLSGRNLGLAASTGDVATTGATVIASQTLTASTTQTLRTDGAVFSANQLSLAAHDVSNAGGQLLQTGTGDLALNLAGNLDNTGGTIATNGKLLVSTSTLSNTQGHISANQSVNIAASASLDNTDGTIGAAQDLRLAGGNLINTRGTVQTTNGNVTLAVADLDNSAGQITATGNLANLSIQAANVNNTGTLYASGSQTLAASGTVSNSGVIAALGGTTITAQNLHSTSSSLLAAGLQADGSLASTGDLHITTTQGLVANGQNIAAGSVRLDSASLDLSGSQTSAVNLALTASAGNLNASHATLVAAQTLSASSTQTLTTDGAVLSAHQLNLGAHDLSNVGGQLLQTGTGDMALQVTDTLDNSHGVIASNSQNLVLSAQTLTNAGGQIQHAGTGTLSISTTAATDNSAGAITSNGDVHVDAYSLRNQGGSLQAAGNLALTTTAAVDNSASGQLGAGGDVALVTGSMDNTQGSITASGKLNATATGTISNTGGLLAAIGDVTLTAAHLNNSQGTVASVQNALSVSTSGTTANDGGSIQAALDVTLQNAGLSNLGSSSSSRITGRNISINTQGQSFNNNLGTLVASQSATLQTGALNNDAGLVQAGTSLGIDTHGQTLTNTHAAGYANGAGGLSAQGAMTLATGDLDNAAGFVGAGGALTATTAQVRNTASSGVGGQIVGNASVTFTSTGFDNRGGQVQALGNVSINVGGGSINNTASLLRSAGTLSLAANTVTNSNTQGTDQGIEGYNVAVAANTIANNTGAIRADNNATLSSSGSINNSQGLVSAGNTLTVQDLGTTKTLAVTNTSGKQIALQALSLNAASLTGNGKMLSQGNLAITLTSDYNNTDEVTANGNASISTTGNITNSGTLQAGNTLSLSASNIDNTATGTLTATTTQLTASNTLTNRGLIDGTETQINAGTLNNIGTGRIYGDHISVAAGTVNNDAETAGGVTTAATIAARSRLDIGATNINNSNGALIFSAGDLAMGGSLDANRHATGAAGTVTNSGSTIQALGNLAIGTATLNNLNPSFAYTLTNGASTSKTDYIATDGSVYVESDFAWVSSRGLAYKPLGISGTAAIAIANGGVLPSSPYADPKYQPFYDSANAYIPEHFVQGNRTHGDGSYTVPDAYNYDNTSSIWAVFGVTPPDGGFPVYPDNGGCDSCSSPTAEQIAAYEASKQPWIDLQAKLDAFRSTVQSSILSFKTYRSYTETTQSAEVTASTPGQILSGDSLNLDVSSANLNDNSRIIAGGALNVTGVAVNNRATEVTANNTRNGTISNWGVTGEDCDGIFGCSATYGWNNGSYTQSTPTTLTLGLGVTQWNTGGSAASTSVSNKILTAAVQGAQTTGGVHVLIASLANDAIGSLVNAQTPNSTRAATPVPSSVPRLTQVSTASGGTVQSVLPNTSLPTASLFHTAPSSTSHYLVETDPAYANYRTWLSSDALLTSLSYDPATVQKRLGDGFYEQQLIREQVAELTGHRFLTGYQNDEAQYQALMASGATYAKQWNLVPGIALSPAQMAQLTTDMVWLVEKTVTLADGSTQKVLVPQLYAVVRDGDLSNTGALLSGGSVNLNLTGDLTNSGTIAGRSVVSLTADNINNLGGRISGSDVAVQAATDLNNIGGQIGASNNLLATAGRDINVTTTTQSTITGTNSFTGIDRVAGLYVTGTNGVPGTLVAAAGRDINLTGAILSSAGTATLQATNNLNLQAVTQAESINATRDADNYTRFAQSQAVGTTVQAQGDLTLRAGADLTAQGAQITSLSGATTLVAGHDVSIGATTRTSSLDTASYAEGSGFLSSGSTRITQSGSTSTSVGSQVSGNTVTVVANNDLAVQGSSITSQTSTLLAAGNNLVVASAQNTSSASYAMEQKNTGLMVSAERIDLKAKNSHATQSSQTTQTASTIASGGNTTLVAGNQLVAYASNLSAGQTLTLQGADVNLQSGLNASSASEQNSSSRGGLSIGPHVTGITPKAKGTQDQQDTTLAATTLDAQNINIKATGDTGANGSITLAGVQAKTPGKLSLDAGADGTLNLNLVTTTQYLAHTSSSGDEMLGKSRDQGSSAETAHYNQLEVGSLSVNTGHVNVQIARTAAEVKAEQAVAAEKAAAEKAAVAAAAQKAAMEKEVARQAQAASASTFTNLANAAAVANSRGSGSSIRSGGSNSTSATVLTSDILAVAPATATTTSTTTPTTTATSVLAKAPTTPPPTLQEKAQLLAQQPGMSYLNQLLTDPQTSSKIDWNAVDLAQKNWDYKHQGLTQAGSIIVAIVVTVVTAGSGTAAALETTVTTAGGAAMGTAAVAGMSTLASQAAVSLINNQGDIGKTLHDLGSSENVKGLVTSMVTAGVLQGLDQTLEIGGVKLSDISAKSHFMDQLSKNLVNGVASTVVSSAITGGSLEDGLKSSIASAFIQTGMAQGANLIGDNTQVNSLANYAAHAIAGCVGGAATSASNGGNSGSAANGCGSGALGAVLGEATAVVYGRNANTVQIASLVSAIGAAVVGGSAEQVSIAAAAGGNAAENNYLNHVPPSMLRLSEKEQYEAAVAACNNGSKAACDTRDTLAQKSAQRDRDLAQACSGSNPVACNDKVREATAMGNTVRTTESGYVYANSPTLTQLNTATIGAPTRVNSFNDTVAQSTADGIVLGVENQVLGAVAGLAVKGVNAVTTAIKGTVGDITRAVTSSSATVSSEIAVSDSTVGGGAGSLKTPWPAQNVQPLPSFIQSGETTCGQTCAAAMAQNLGYKDVTEQTLNSALGTGEQTAGSLSGALKNTTGATTQGGAVPFNPAELSSTQVQSVINNLTGNGSQPVMVLLNSPGSSITSSGHWVLVDGLDSLGNVVIKDPAGLKYTMTTSNFSNTWKSGSIVTLKK